MASEDLPQETEPNKSESNRTESTENSSTASSQEPQKAYITRLPPICPYLGLWQDRTVIAISPTPAHACYALEHRFSPSIEHQGVRCFNDTYPQCSYYPQTVPNKKTGESVDDPKGLYSLQYKTVDSKWNWRRGARRWVIIAIGLLLLVSIIAPLVTGMFPLRVNNPPVPTATPEATPTEILVVAPTPTVQITPEPTVQPSPTENLQSSAGQTDSRGQMLTIRPKLTDVGWWVSNETQISFIGDSFLYAGFLDGMAYLSAIHFDLTQVARGSAIHSATLRLTGLNNSRLDQNVEINWQVQLIPESSLPELQGANFATVFIAPASVPLNPVLTPLDVAPDRVNEWVFDENTRNWLFRQILEGATSITARISAYPVQENALFAWDSGFASESQGAVPELVLDLGPAPPTPLPTPTPPRVIATLTPEPGNVLTVVARTPEANQGQPTVVTSTATAVPDVVTPTPLPQNLEAAQTAAVAEGLPPVVLNTPVPANVATATTNAAYATAVALTTGTYTPVPTDYVTPVLYYPSPPAENIATAAAQSSTATAIAIEGGTPTPTLPWNAIPAVYEYATPTPGNQETAIARNEEQNSVAATTGTPTPTPWNLVVITRVPEPSPTPIPLIILTEDITPTPTPTPTRALTNEDFAKFRNKILFKSDRSGEEQTWILDPTTFEVVGLITDDRIFEQARELYLTYSPDGTQQAIVKPDSRDDLQIMVEDFQYGTIRQITNLDFAISYDPAWSPNGNWIAFVSTDSGGDEIYVVDPNGGEPQRLTFNSWEWDKHPTWSPDSTRIAFFSNRETGRKQIWIMDVDGSEQQNISNSDFEDWDPVWVR